MASSSRSAASATEILLAGSPNKPSSEKHAGMPSRRKGHAEKSVLDDIMGDPDDFGDIGESDAESDGGRWEDTLRERYAPTLPFSISLLFLSFILAKTKNKRFCIYLLFP